VLAAIGFTILVIVAGIVLLRDRITKPLPEAEAAVEVVQGWASDVRIAMGRAEDELRWVTRDQRLEWEANRPTVKVSARLRKRFDLGLHSADLALFADGVNGRIRERALAERKDLLDSIESQPLTDEQATAVVTMDNRVQVVAAAGSGKTSVMVARAAYAIRFGLVPAGTVLLLAFNRDAAEKLESRLKGRLGAAGIDSTGLTASTFHAFGLSVIGRATGRKPRLASWLDGGQDVATVSHIVDELRDSDAGFRFKWDLYRLLFARMSEDTAEAQPDSYDKKSRITGFGTMNGEVVKSEGERLIADWLFLNGITYGYERPYSHDVADESHSQYRPDFFYPDIDVWHEHWAIGRDGKPPAEFVGYAEATHWKKETHRRFGTTLLETTWTEILDTTGFGPLHDQLAKRGVTFDWNPERARGTEAVSHEDLAKLIRTVMTHVKSKASRARRSKTDGRGRAGRTALGSSSTSTGRSMTRGNSGCSATSPSTSRTC
jgi:DNA helicase IV